MTKRAIRRRAQALPTEHAEQARFFGMVAGDPRTSELLIYAVPNFPGHVGSHVSRMRAGAHLNDEGRKKGALDINVDEPHPRVGVIYDAENLHLHDAHGLRIEMKQKGRSATPEQAEWIVKLRARGFIAELCFTADEAWSVLVRYLGIETSA